MTKEDFVSFFNFALEVANGIKDRDNTIAQLQAKLGATLKPEESNG